jgi:phosphoribosyl 1,2-cyclic phosphodiesterase/DNA-binding response OmpR family regulator
MQVRFWGTRGSIAKAGAETVRYGGNTSCVEVRASDGTLVVLDCGTGAHGLGQALVASGERDTSGHILITHTHWDHIQGFPFFAPLRESDTEWWVYGPGGSGSSLRDTLAGQMQYTYFPVTLEDLGASVHYRNLTEGSFEIGGIHVTAQYLNHPALTIGYRLEADGVVVVYATDHEPRSRELAIGAQAIARGDDARHAEFLSGANLIIHDAQYIAEEYPARIGWGHSTVEFAVDVAQAVGAHRLALFHHDPNRNDDALDGLVKLGRDRAAYNNGALQVMAAAEGRTIELKPAPKPRKNAVSREESALQPPLHSVSGQQLLIGSGNADLVRQLTNATKEEGVASAHIGTGEEMIERILHDRPSLVLLDRSLPGLSPRSVCRIVRKTQGDYGKQVPVVIVESAEDPFEHDQDVQAGVTDWLQTPFEPTYARTRVRAWLLRTACRWARAPIPSNEAQRIEALHRLHILDTRREERFDRYTRIAAALFEVPIALVTLIDTNRQWFKSCYGMEGGEAPRDVAFCSHAIVGDAVLQVPDALQDRRFADNPLVTGEPRVRFYAGAPLTLQDGSRVGTLCLVDNRPRQLVDAQVEMLADLANLVVDELQSPSASDAGDG